MKHILFLVIVKPSSTLTSTSIYIEIKEDLNLAYLF